MITVLILRNEPDLIQSKLDFLSKYKLKDVIFDNKTMIILNENLIISRYDQDLNLVLSIGSWNSYFAIKKIPAHIEKKYINITYNTIFIDYERKISDMYKERGIDFLKRKIYVLTDISNLSYKDNNIKNILEKYQIFPWFFNFDFQTMIKLGSFILPRYNQELNLILYSADIKMYTVDTFVDQKYIKIVKDRPYESVSVDYDKKFFDLLKIPIAIDIPEAEKIDYIETVEAEGVRLFI